VKKKRVKYPSANGRPIFMILNLALGGEKFRIIYPNGFVEFQYGHWLGYSGGEWFGGCTSRATQRQALEACKQYDSETLSDLIHWEYL
jgi:hypothetical protein